MEYLMKWQAWLEHSELYREFLINLPSPLNNVYFDLLLLFIGIFMIIRWIWDSIAIHRRYKRIRKRQKKIQQAHGVCPAGDGAEYFFIFQRSKINIHLLCAFHRS